MDFILTLLIVSKLRLETLFIVGDQYSGGTFDTFYEEFDEDITRFTAPAGEVTESTRKCVMIHLSALASDAIQEEKPFSTSFDLNRVK